MSLSRCGRVRRFWWSLTNWLHGYKFGPVQRCRLCHHTSPSHYPGCDYWRGENLDELIRRPHP